MDFDVLYLLPGVKEGAITKQGYLKKQGSQHKSWKRRWFRLDSNKISYFGSMKASHQKVRLSFISLLIKHPGTHRHRND